MPGRRGQEEHGVRHAVLYGHEVVAPQRAVHEALDEEGLAKAVLYPTLGILWEPEVRDPEIAAAYTRAYNRWIMDFCADSAGRLVPIAHISLSDPKLAATETERALKAGAKGIFLGLVGRLVSLGQWLWP